MADIIYLQNVRLSFPKLIEASAAKPGDPKKWGANFILEPNDPQFAKFMGELGKVATEKWKENANVILTAVQQDRKMRCFGQGSELIDKKTFAPYLGYAGKVFITSSSVEEKPPLIIRADGTPVDNANTMERQALARKLYGGAYVNCAVLPWAQDNEYGRALRNQLIAVQFFADGEAFGDAPPNVDGIFQAIPQATPEAVPMPAGFPSFFGQS